MAGIDDDFGDLLGLEEGEELVMKKDGEEIKAVEEKKEEPKPVQQVDYGHPATEPTKQTSRWQRQKEESRQSYRYRRCA
jgi:hypothetical protein